MHLSLQDGPGELSSTGQRRHDNDFLRIADIKVRFFLFFFFFFSFRRFIPL